MRKQRKPDHSIRSIGLMELTLMEISACLSDHGRGIEANGVFGVNNGGITNAEYLRECLIRFSAEIEVRKVELLKWLDEEEVKEKAAAPSTVVSINQ